MKIIKETNDYVLVNYHWPEPIKQYVNTASKQKKFLCIGGEFDGQLKASCQLGHPPDAYVAFNCADNPWVRTASGLRKKSRHTQIWVAKKLLS
jgi:hypothetical protein